MKDRHQYQLPDIVTSGMRHHFPDAAEAWIEQFPVTLDSCVERWRLRLGAVSPHMSISFIVFARNESDQEVALKLGVPHREQRTEMEALRHYHGRGCVACVGTAPDLGALLMQRVTPGTMLLETGDEASQTAIAAKAMRTLPIPEPERHGLPTFEELLQRAIANVRAIHGPDYGPVPAGLIDLAEQVLKDIDEAEPRGVLLHGDLHHENLLYDDHQGWLAIDPKGVIGAPILEVGRFMRNLLPDDAEGMERSLRTRSWILATELGCSAREVMAGAYVDAALGTCWSAEERSPDVAGSVARLELCARILKE